ncbi:hypothetical protein QAD02_000180 [Eretmocerus hayati]|uniref:Uncharacterized protein n=1 Tax=Eretmocerus hayati TaxID=131215 RepID=A0ACC2NE99_9HYME|nr:hypothetical protein QAD02_000180 [Eretmocerus hayati]
MLKLLLDRGANPNRANTKRYSVLAIATCAQRNRIEMLKILLDYGADMYNGGTDCGGLWPDKFNPYPFEGMFERNYIEGVLLFLERGYDPRNYRCVSKSRPTALHVAIDISEEDFSGKGPDTRMLSLLIDHYRAKGILSSELERGLQQNCSPLFHALNRRRHAHAALLMRSGADPNLEGNGGEPALGHVLYKDFHHLHYKSIKLLIQHGAHVRDYIKRLVSEAVPEYCGDSSPNNYSDASSESDPSDSDIMVRTNVYRRNEYYRYEEYDGYSNDDEYDDMKDPQYRRSRRSMKKALCIVKYRILYEIKNSVEDPIHEKIGISRTLQRYYDNCKSEIDFMNNFPFEDSITYLDVLTDADFWRRVKSPDIFMNNWDNRTLDFWDILTGNLSIYMSDLNDSVKVAYGKCKAWKAALKGLQCLIGFDKDAYHLIFSRILNDLETEDWRNLGRLVGEFAECSDDDAEF